MAVGFTSALNLLYNVLVSHFLQPAKYGAFGSLLGVLVVVAVPAAAMQVILTREITRVRSGGLHGGLGLRSTFARFTGCGLVACGVLAALAPVLSAYLHLSSPLPVLVVASYAVPMAMDIVPRSVLLGDGRYRVLALGLLVSGLGRLAVGVVLMDAGCGLSGAVAANVIGEVGCLLVLMPAVASHLGPAPIGSSAIILRPARQAGAVAALAGYWSLNGVDSVMARHYLSPQLSGVYSSYSIIAGVATFLPTAIAPVMVPRFASFNRRTATGAAGASLTKVVAAVGALASLGGLLVAVLGPITLHHVYSTRFFGPREALYILAVSASLLAVSDCLIYLLLTSNSYAPSYLPWVGVGVVLVASAISHAGMDTIAVEASAATFIVTLTLAVASLKTFWNHGRISAQVEMRT